MKNKNIIFVIFILFLLSFKVYPQSGWIQQSPLPLYGALTSVKFINGNTGLMVGLRGAIIKTNDGGVTWQNISSNSTKDLLDLNFINQNTGFIVGNYSLILKTTNTGDNWTTVFSSDSAYYLSKINFININTGFVYRAADSTLLKTTNCGNNWSSIKTNILRINSYSSGLLFINENTGFYIGPVFNIYKTTNGGTIWNPTNMFPDKFNCFYFFDQNTGLAIGFNGKILKTTNTGENWVYQTPVSPSLSLTDIKFLDSLNGFMFGYNSGITYRTTDRGNNWTALLGSGYFGMNGFDYPDINTGYIVGSAGKVFKTTNSGVNWAFISSGTIYNLNSSHFANNNIGFAAGNDEILKTTNGGNMWLSLSGRYVSDIFVSVNCYDTNSIIAISWNLIQKTTNGGMNWVTKDAVSTGNLTGTSYINNTCYYFTGGTILGKSTDAGETWTHINSGIYMTSMYFINENTGFASEGYSPNNIYKTTNGGENWNLIFTGAFNDKINSMFFSDQNNGFAVTFDRFAKTTNGGINWTSYILSANYNLNSLFMTNINTGFIAGYGGLILKTTNSGQNWISQNSGTSNDLNHIYFLDSNTGYAVGQYGVIIKTTNGGSVWVNNINEKIPDNYLLYQNFPNPFNPNTIIRFQIKDSRFTTLKVYDILGKEIETLVNEKLQPGTYEFQFDGSKLPSGIYFYRIQAGDFIQVKKMLLIK